ncbi:MAG: ATP synthase F1 subunit epsilon [Bacteroidales bacterium]|jgi:F-type H+-transporting ATPase subunit epsilon
MDMLLEIIAPDQKLFSGEVDLVQVPGSKGSFEILRNHAPIISTLEQGRIKIVDLKGGVTFFEVTGGVIEAKNNKIIVLAENAKK